jgi:hypothetical protein
MSWDIECHTTSDDFPDPINYNDTCFLICADIRNT